MIYNDDISTWEHVGAGEGVTVMESSGPRKNACGEIRGKLLFRDLILAGVVHERRITRIRGKVRFISSPCLFICFVSRNL